VARYKELHRLQRERAKRITEFYQFEGAGSGGVLADFYVSREDEALRYNDSPDEFRERAQYKRITPLELSTLWAIIRRSEWDVALMDEFPCLHQEDDGSRRIHRLPAAMLVDLAGMSSEEITIAAQRWAATEEMRWPSTAAHEVICDIERLALSASESGRSVYLWNCL
jgi:hypothetical protein